MIKQTALTVILGITLAANGSDLPQLVQLDSSKIESVTETLLAQDKRARVLFPITLTLIAGGTAYVAKKTLWDDAPVTINQEQKGLLDKLKAFLAKEKQDKNDANVNANDSKATTWKEYFTAKATNASQWIQKTLPTTLGTMLATHVTSRVFKGAIGVVESKLPSLDVLYDNVLANRTLEWYRVERTKYDAAADALRKYLGGLTYTFALGQKAQCEQQLAELQNAIQGANSEELTEEQMGGLLQAFEQLQAQMAQFEEVSEPTEKQLSNIKYNIMVAHNWIVKETQKILGYMNYVTTKVTEDTLATQANEGAIKTVTSEIAQLKETIEKMLQDTAAIAIADFDTINRSLTMIDDVMHNYALTVEVEL